MSELVDSPSPPLPLQQPSRGFTAMSTETTESEANAYSEAGAIPAWVGIFQEAAKYGDVFHEEQHDSETSSLSDGSGSGFPDSPVEENADGTITPTTALPPTLDTERIDQLMNNLILEDKIGPAHHTTRLEKLSANAYHAPGKSITGMGGNSEVVPDSAPVISEAELAAANDRVIPLLVQEFGALAAEGEEEKLLVESDGAYFQDVAILGIIHLTTHRVTFHASLLSTRPDLNHQSQIIKSGPVVIHRAGLRRKRRVWLELSHDMICSFPDSTDEGRVRPIRAVLLGDIKEVKPVDPAEPRSMRMVFRTSTGVRNGHVELDTIESAANWRQELNGALHEFRQHRNTLFRGDSSSQDTSNSGVKIAVPLHHIESFQSRHWGSFANVVTLTLATDSSLAESENIGSVPFGLVDNDDHDSSLRSSSSDAAQRTLTLTVIQGFNADRLRNAIDTAKKCRAVTPAAMADADQVVVDFGELSMVDPVMVDGVATEVNDVASHARRVFALPADEEIWHVRAAAGKFNTSSGYLVVNPRYICFWAKSLVTDTKLRFYAHDVNKAFIPVDKRTCKKLFHRMILQVKGHKDITFAFKSRTLCDEAVERINACAAIAKERHAKRHLLTPSLSSAEGSEIPAVGTLVAASAVAATSPLATAAPLSPTAELASPEQILQRHQGLVIPTDLLAHVPHPINLPQARPHIEQQHFACLTIGSRGDVQPYIALCLGLKKEGHKVTIITHEEYKAWIEAFGINHLTAGGDPGALMKLSVEHKIFSPQFFKESLGHFRQWLDDLLVDSYDQVKASGATVLIESPSAMAGVHIAESLNIPYFRAFTMPWSRTAEYPHAFISPPDFVAGSFNFSTYVLFDNVFWLATAPQINPWRKKHLGLPHTDLEHLAQTKIPFLYNFSPNVVPKPLDWSDTTMITGYWFLDNPDVGWAAPESLLAFIAKARADKKPLVYIGFGSIVVENPKAMTKSIVKAVLKSDVRAILNKGWSARMAGTDTTPEVAIPAEIYEVEKIPHDWLFPQIDAALHHGGAGTTGASLRAGIPTLIKPWFGDQFFWAARVQKLGAGLRVASLSSSDLAHALTKATSDRIILEKAQAVGEKIREEDGVGAAISSLYMYLHRAGVRMPHHHHKHGQQSVSSNDPDTRHPQHKAASNARELAAMVDELPQFERAGGATALHKSATIA